MTYSHKNRRLQLTTTLGTDELIIGGLRGREALSELFRFELDLVSMSGEIPFKDLLGKPVTVGLVMADGKTSRYFNGHISRFVQGSQDTEGLTSYRAQVVPWLWFLTLTSNCRIFQHMSTQEIITKVFSDLGFSDYEFRKLSAGQEPREYCVQYRESAFNFVSRLLEEEGIFYFFEHYEDRHVLVMADAAVEHPPCPYQEEVRCTRYKGPLNDAHEIITDLSFAEEVRTSKAAVQDFSFLEPSTSLESQCTEQEDYEDYDYPGLYFTADKGEGVSRLRLEQHAAFRQTLRGTGTCGFFTAGHKFKLKDYLRTDVEADQIIMSVDHEVRQPVSSGPESGMGGQGTFRYRNTFTAFPLSLTYRPPRRTRKPVVTGSQTATVVGKSGEEIWTDEHGRVVVQFHWDREGKRDEKSSCWVRVTQPWAGKQWGAFFLPRIGQEVIVDFLEGDPDRPIIVGQVYNAEQVPPYALPDNQTRTTIKTLSSKGGEGFNEIRFEDKKGEEQIFVHAERNYDLRVKSNSMSNVGGNANMTVGGGEDGEGGTFKTNLEKDYHLKVKGESRVLVEGKSSLRVKGDTFEDHQSNQKVTVAQEAYLSATTIILEASTSFTVKGPGGFIKIDASGVTIVGAPQVKINSGGSPDVSAISGQVDEPEDPAGADDDSPGFPSNS